VSDRADKRAQKGWRGSLGGAAVAGLVVAVVTMMIVPLPTWLLDLLITLNIGASVTLLLAAVYAKDALSIATFPTLLVLTTLYRLGLNVSTTRLILLRGDAGRVVSAFGNVVVGGETVVGAAVFLILTIVQYVVISRGAERVAEVAARFTLDAMPGKQLAIDGDLRAGAIDADEARRRRNGLNREAQLYGALDGAMRFVKGDAIAGILILVIAIVGGLVVGILYKGMEVGAAVKLYTLLTIGDGLVSQLPALLISTAAGLVVTRVASDEEGGALGADVVRQLGARPITLAIVAGLLLLLALVPRMPIVPFLVVAVPFGVAAYVSFRRKRTRVESPPLVPESPAAVEVAIDPALDAAAPELDRALDTAARKVVDDLGIPLARVVRTVDERLPPRGYEVRLRGVPMADGLAPDGKLLADAPPARLQALDLEGTPTPHPVTGAVASWVAASAAAQLQAAGITCHDTQGTIAAALDGTLRRFAHELLGFDETQRLLDGLSRTSPALVREVVPRRVDVATLTEVLRRLLAEGVPIGDLRDVLEAVAGVREPAKDPAVLTERVRAELRRHITHRLARNKRVEALVLDPLVEEAVRDALRSTEGGQVLALEPALAGDILAAVKREIDARDGQPVIITSSELRRHVRRLVEGDHPQVAVITYGELNPDVHVEPVGRIAV
jgi:type III secretion protein V